MNKNLIIRLLKQEDLTLANKLIWSTFLLFEAPEYSKEGIQVFKDFIEVKVLKKALKNKEMIFWGAYYKQELIGVIALQKDHISLFFVKQDYQRRGFGKLLLNTALTYLKENDYHQVSVNSSPYGLSIYLHLGFKAVATVQNVNGIIFTPLILVFNNTI